ncbi:MAG: hypothetical protein AAFX99_25210, partial [Myxococcota bacterium]
MNSNKPNVLGQSLMTLSLELQAKKMIWTLVGLSFGLMMAVVFSSAMAEESELDSDDRLFPYNGYLDLDGARYNGSADFQFTIQTDDNQLCPDHVELHENVVVYSGRFNINIGSGTFADGTQVTGVPGCIFDSQRVYIRIAVRGAESNEEHTALSGRQRIHPVPFSYWAAEGSDLKVDGDIN